MNDWEVVEKELQLESIANEMVGGADVYLFTVRFIDTGDTRKVLSTEDNLHEKIANGEFYD